MRKLTAADEELFRELWAGALFDLIHAVEKKRPGWDGDERGGLIVMVIEELARRYGIVAEDEGAELRALLVECRDELDRLFFNQAGDGTADLIERLNAALKDAPPIS
jgi:hypothetical protein